jgi:hypothetical protein
LSRNTGSGGEIEELGIKSRSIAPGAGESIQNMLLKPARSAKAPMSRLALNKTVLIRSAQHQYTQQKKERCRNPTDIRHLFHRLQANPALLSGKRRGSP